MQTERAFTKFIPATIGVLMFSLTFIAVVLGSRGFDTIVISFGRVLLLAPAAIITLRAQKLSLLPARADLKLIIVVAVGVVIGYPSLTSFALSQLSVGASGVINSLTPIIASVFAVWIGHGRPKRQFWFAALAGMVATILFALSKDGHLISTPIAVIALFFGVIAAAGGNTAGATLSGRQKSFNVISWATLVATPVTLTVTVLDIVLNPHHGLSDAAFLAGTVPPEAWLGFAYAALISSFGGHFFWLRGLERVGVVRGSQLMLGQAPVTLIWGLLLLGQVPTLLTWAAALVVVACVGWSQRAK